MIGQSVQVNYDNRELSLYRLPSSSRAYPLALEKSRCLQTVLSTNWFGLIIKGK